MKLVIDGKLNPERLSTKDGKQYYNGSLDLSGTAITSLPEGLSVGCSLYLSGTAIQTTPLSITAVMRNVPSTSVWNIKNLSR